MVAEDQTKNPLAPSLTSARVKLHKMGVTKPIGLGGQKEAGLSFPLGLTLLLISLHQFLSLSGPSVSQFNHRNL